MLKPCECGCDTYVKGRFAHGHHMKTEQYKLNKREKTLGRTPWNKGKKGVQVASEETKIKQRESRLKWIAENNDEFQRQRSYMNSDLNPMKIPEYRTLHETVMRSEEHRRKISEAVSGSNNGMFGKKHSESTKIKIREKAFTQFASGKGPRQISSPNSEETALLNLMNDKNLPYVFVGNSLYWVRALDPTDDQLKSMNPDFLCYELPDGCKKVVEYYGSAWHKPGDDLVRMKMLGSIGIDCCVVWDWELKDSDRLYRRLQAFTYPNQYHFIQAEDKWVCHKTSCMMPLIIWTGKFTIPFDYNYLVMSNPSGYMDGASNFAYKKVSDK